MFLNERRLPEIVLEIDAVLNRLSPFHFKRQILEDERKSYMTGYHGELKIDWYLKALDNGKFFIIAGLRLIYQNQAFQIDTLIVTRTFLLIIESKNIAGTLKFEKDSTQVIRELNGKTQGFKNPIIQVKRQKILLMAWLKKNKFPLIPVADLVGIADRRTIIVTTDDNRKIFEKLIHADVLQDKIRQLESIHTKELLTSRQVHKLNQLLINEQTPAPPSILNKHQIDQSELSKGNQCPQCKHFPLIRQAQNWYCSKCKSYSKYAHNQSVRDYFLIISPVISNKQFREFLLSDSPDTVRKLLLRMNLQTSGSNKNRLYHRPQFFG